VLRVGVGQLPATNPLSGVRQITQILTVQGLARPGEDGRMQPVLGESWTWSPDGRLLTVQLRPDVKFHDGSPLDAAAAAAQLPDALRTVMGPVFREVDHVRATGSSTVEIGYHHASPLLIEALEAPIRKRGAPSVATGPFKPDPQSPGQLDANRAFYLGPPVIDRVTVQTFPSVRAAWAELLRNGIDMLYEVGPDALDSLEKSSVVSVFTFTRPYQHVIVLNTRAPSLTSADRRRALNLAIDREAFVQNALNGHGVPSSGPIWPKYWAFQEEGATRALFDPRGAAKAFGVTVSKDGAAGQFRFSCLVPPDSVNERIALELKRQLATVRVDMVVEEVPPDQLIQRVAEGRYEAALFEIMSGPSLFRPYLQWHTGSPLNDAKLGSAVIDAALDRVAAAPSESEYRAAVARLQQAFNDDPPGIFLAWSVRARAVSTRFAIPEEPGRDVLATLRLWKPSTEERAGRR
jgi:peptide/nickel transport system substrate-binding protein